MTPTPSVPSRILVVDDHPIVRLGIRRTIEAEPDLAVCGEAESAEAALTLAASLRPDLAIVDLSLDRGVDLELIRALRKTTGDLRILVLSIHDETLFAERALRAGAQGYVMKSAVIPTLIDAIRRVLAGRVHLSERMEQRVLDRLRGAKDASQDPIGTLTDREVEIFDRIGRGQSTAAMAKQLGVSVKTIESHRASIKAKLRVKDRTELIRLAALWSTGGPAQG